VSISFYQLYLLITITIITTLSSKYYTNDTYYLSTIQDNVKYLLHNNIIMHILQYNLVYNNYKSSLILRGNVTVIFRICIC